MHKIECIEKGEKNIGTFYCAGQGLTRGPPGYGVISPPKFMFSIQH